MLTHLECETEISHWLITIFSLSSFILHRNLGQKATFAFTAMGETAGNSTLPPLGFISIDIHFHRPPGDPYNDKTWPFPILREQAEDSTESDVVTGEEYDNAFIDRFVDAGQKLVAKGCVGIITSCGFLAMAQPEYVLSCCSFSFFFLL